MKSSAKRLKEILVAANLYGLVHGLHAATVGRSASKARAKMIDFFETLLPQGALAFDIGANAGSISRALACAGARVVAVEPNSDCVRNIQLIHRQGNIQVIQAAVGSHDGLATLHISDSRDFTCTLSPDWIARMQASDPRYADNWLRQAAVPLITADTLVKHFGEPYFIKIDVEGYELEVLRGLTKQPPLLSFEFHRTFLEAGLECLDFPVFDSGSQFNVVLNADWGYPTQFRFDKWLSRAEMRSALADLAGADDQGDIYVRKPEPHSDNRLASA